MRQVTGPEALTAALRQQRALAGRGRRTVRWCAPLADVDPWALGRRCRAGMPAVAWHDGATGCCFVAYGRLAQVDNALRQSGARQARMLRDGLVAVGPVDDALWRQLPVLLGTAPFFPRPPAGRGQARALPWPRRRPWFLPQLLCWRQPATAHVAARLQLVLSAALPADAAGCRALARRWWRTATVWRRAASVPDDQAPRRPTPHGAAVDRLSAARALESRASFYARVNASLALLRRGPLRKLVLARAVVLEAGLGRRIDALATAVRLRRLHPEATVFSFAHGRSTAFVGATPELLARVVDARFVGHALAGTRARRAGAAADAAARRALLASAKDRAEHAAVVAGLRRALRPACALAACPIGPVARATRQLWHLHTPVSGRLRRGYDLLDLVRALHPTPAVGGTPTPLALRHLRRQEPWRGDNAGPAGWLAVGGGTFVVAIRSMLLTPQRAYAFAGAGIVEGSVAEAEWQEICAKLGTALAGIATCPG